MRVHPAPYGARLAGAAFFWTAANIKRSNALRRITDCGAALVFSEEPVFLYKRRNTDKGCRQSLSKITEDPAPHNHRAAKSRTVRPARRRLSHQCPKAGQRGAEPTENHRAHRSDARAWPGDGRKIRRTRAHRARMWPIARIDRDAAGTIPTAPRFCRPRCLAGKPG